MEVQSGAIRGTYEELADAAEDISDILSAVANNRLDLTLTVQEWLLDHLERIELTLARNVDATASLSARVVPRPVRHGAEGGPA